MRIKPNGRVGIGTDDYETLVHIKSTTTSAILKVEATANSGSEEGWLQLQTPTSNYGLFANDLIINSEFTVIKPISIQ